MLRSSDFPRRLPDCFGRMMAETKEFISKGRLDALTDGIFAFAMTLLVVNFDLPEADVSRSFCAQG
jgi:uncharacterized membrane protein